jgi:predicted dehydrogenase
MTSKLRWGILSTGAIAHKFARGVLRSQKGELAAVASRSAEKADDFARQYRIAGVYDSYEALIADPNIDIVYIATPHPHHREWALRAAHSRKHILCEKPLGVHHDEAVEMLQAVWENGVFFMEAYMYRCHPQIARTLDLLRAGTIGDIRTITARFGFHATYDLEGRLFSRTLGGGGILDVGGYCTSMARLIAGAAKGAVVEPEKVFAVGQIGMESGVDEYAAALLLFPHDIVATLSCGLLLNQDNKVRIEGTEGSITLPNPWIANVDGGETQILVQRNGSAPEMLTVASAPLYALEADLVADQIAQGRLEAPWPAMTWADSLGNIRVQDQWRRALDATGPSFAEPPGKGTQPLPFTTWQQRFSRLFQASVEKYQQGHHKAENLADTKGRKFLASIGYSEQEFFDFVEDFSRGGEPTLETALDIAAVRRDYFLKQQNGIASTKVISVDQLPAKDAEVEGIAWLPRLLPKAEAKLRGEMPPELMYCCGGDRRFFKTHHVDPAEFLRRVWKADGNHADVIAWVKAESKANR